MLNPPLCIREYIFVVCLSPSFAHFSSRSYGLRLFRPILPPGRTLLLGNKRVCVYHELGFVVKYFMDDKVFAHELLVHQALTGLKRIPTLIARGSTTTSIPFLVTSYCGTPIVYDELTPDEA